MPLEAESSILKNLIRSKAKKMGKRKDWCCNIEAKLLYVVGGICSIKLSNWWNVPCTHFVWSRHLPMIKVMLFFFSFFPFISNKTSSLDMWGKRVREKYINFRFNERNFCYFFFWISFFITFWKRPSTCHVKAPGLTLQSEMKWNVHVELASCEFGAYFLVFALPVRIITVLMNKIRGFHSWLSPREAAEGKTGSACVFSPDSPDVMKNSCWINHRSKASINFNWRGKEDSWRSEREEEYSSCISWWMDKTMARLKPRNQSQYLCFVFRHVEAKKDKKKQSEGRFT